MEVLPPPGGNIQAPPYFTPHPQHPSLSRSKYIWNIDTQQVSYNPKSTTTTKSQNKSCLLLRWSFQLTFWTPIMCNSPNCYSSNFSHFSFFSLFRFQSFIPTGLLLVFAMFQFSLALVIIFRYLLVISWIILKDLKGVLHPRPVFGLFLHFSQKLQHIGNK